MLIKTVNHWKNKTLSERFQSVVCIVFTGGSKHVCKTVNMKTLGRPP